MKYSKKKYKTRLVDLQINKYLKTFPIIYIEGPKWCGKTWAAINRSGSIANLDDEATYEMAITDLDLILTNTYPELIDKCNLVPNIWDKMRTLSNRTTKKGRYILTSSIVLNDEKNEKTFNSGLERIGKLKMSTMSLYESKDSTGVASITAMYKGKQKNVKIEKLSILNLSKLIVRGGWPENLRIKNNEHSLIAKKYILSILTKDINDDKKRDERKMMHLLKALARNESTVVTVKTLMRDMKEHEHKDIIESEKTVFDYINVLERLFVIENQEAYTKNYRSKERIGKSAKKHFTAPSIAAYLLNLSAEKLSKDLKTLVFLFKSLVERDLRIYMENLGGRLCHFRDNVSGLEVDSVLEFENGDYALCEVKLSESGVEEAKKHLLKLKSKMNKPPKFMCIILGLYDAVVKDKETGIYLVPINALKI